MILSKVICWYNPVHLNIYSINNKNHLHNNSDFIIMPELGVMTKKKTSYT